MTDNNNLTPDEATALQKRAAALVEKQKAWDKWEYPSQPAPPAMVKGEIATLVSDMDAEITRLRAACDASEERERAIELRFWQTVDRDGLTGLPSDMWAALEQLVRDRAAAKEVKP